MKKYKTVNEKTIFRYSKKYNIPTVDCYELDSSYNSFLISLNGARYKTQRKNHYQPLQALYYDETGQLKSFQINCYAGGFPNLEWDRNEIMTTFPPKQQAPIDSVLPLDKHLKYLRPLSRTQKFSVDSLDYLIVVYWSRFMGRQSKRLIRIIQNNSKLSTYNRMKIIYVNTDNFFNLTDNK